jgi:hypothetical protein
MGGGGLPLRLKALFKLPLRPSGTSPKTGEELSEQELHLGFLGNRTCLDSPPY